MTDEKHARPANPKKRGRPQKFADSAILQRLGIKPKTVPVLAYQLGQKENTVYYRLRSLLAEGKVKREKIGRSFGWSLA